MTGTFASEFDARLQAMPVVAILRGLSPDDAIPVCEALLDAGISLAEVPLNSPQPLQTIAMLRAHFGERMVIGAGTVLQVAQVEALAQIGCRFCVAPNTDVEVIRACLDKGMLPIPGFSTASEAFAGVAAGALHLKAFPAQVSTLAALKAVLPPAVRVIAVGGVSPDDVEAMLLAGAVGFGAGSDLYRPGRSVEGVAARARRWVDALQRSRATVVQLVCNPETMVGEGPVLLGQSIYWVDPTTPRLLQWKSKDGCVQRPLTEPVWSLGVLGDGTLVGNGESHFVRFDGSLRVLQAGPEIALDAGCRLNDLIVDARGGLWASSMHRGVLAGHGAVFHAPSFEAPARRVAAGLGAANGMALAPDQRTLFVIDTLHRTLLAYPADIEQGTLGEPLIVTDFLGLPGKPDGMVLAADGSFWVAMWGAGQVVQIAPNGAFLRSVEVHAPHVGSLCFGPSGELFVSTARARLSEQALARYPGSGGLFRIT